MVPLGQGRQEPLYGDARYHLARETVVPEFAHGPQGHLAPLCVPIPPLTIGAHTTEASLLTTVFVEPYPHTVTHPRPEREATPLVRLQRAEAGQQRLTNEVPIPHVLGQPTEP